MTRKPENFEWLNFTKAQRELLEDIDFYGNNGWDRNGQSDEVMPKLLAECEQEGLSITRIQAAMMEIGYDRRTVHEIQRWENKRRTGRFGK